ncbi:TauD/TfdA family dioxygenase [Planosporangium thailandense]|uniref:TauD/TfdA family dioxygenase n=2 Tax=Planosporangium thailandense TaxID=765197 RepID=A0ABX0XZX2_9ACTN|nr:TauD/TfdA family dioxygenase [Planosporangium thailandense]
MLADDDLSSTWIRAGRQFFDVNKTSIRIDRGAVLIWDNWRMLHARNAFSDPGRHLRRVLIAQR